MQQFRRRMELVEVKMVFIKKINFELYLALICILLGLGVSVVISPKTCFFLSNFTFYWGSQLFVLALLLPFKPRPAIVAGTAISLAIYLTLFYVWLMSQQHPESLAWIVFIFSLPGATIASISIVLWFRKHPTFGPIQSALITSGATIAGIAINQAVLHGILGVSLPLF